MTKPTWEKASVPMRNGHSRGNTGPSCFLKVTRARLLVIFSFYWLRLHHGEDPLLLLNDLYIRILMKLTNRLAKSHMTWSLDELRKYSLLWAKRKTCHRWAKHYRHYPQKAHFSLKNEELSSVYFKCDETSYEKHGLLQFKPHEKSVQLQNKHSGLAINPSYCLNWQ